MQIPRSNVEMSFSGGPSRADVAEISYNAGGPRGRDIVVRREAHCTLRRPRRKAILISCRVAGGSSEDDGFWTPLWACGTEFLRHTYPLRLGSLAAAPADELDKQNKSRALSR